jgi:hypothetical protein
MSEENNSAAAVQDDTDLTTLVGPDSKYKKLAEHCFTDELLGNTTWGDAKQATQIQFLAAYGTSPNLQIKLIAWIDHYGLSSRFKQQQQNGKLRCCSRIHFCIISIFTNSLPITNFKLN